MVEEGDLDDKLEDKATNEVVDDVKKVAMEGVDKEKKQVAMKVANTNCLDDLIDNCPTFHHFMENPSQRMCTNPSKRSPEFLKSELYLIFLFGTTLSPSLFASLWWHRSKGRHEGPRK